MIRPRADGAPSALLPLAYMMTAAAAFMVATLGVPWLANGLSGHYYQPWVLALAHTVTLGWITLTIMGASYQLLPIVLERPLWSERLARWQLAIMVTGVIGMVGHFAIGRWPGLVWSIGITAVGIGAHLVNGVLSLRGIGRWTFTARLLALALAGLALTTLVGLIIAVDKLWRFLPGGLFPNLHAHVHLALLGWVLPMILGVAARVYPMFLLVDEPSGWIGHVQLGGLALGVPVVVAGLAGQSAVLVAAGALAVAAAVAGHLAWVADMVWHRRRPALDWGLSFVLTGAAFLVPATLVGLGLAFDLLSGPRAALAYAVLALGGWVSLTIVGMMLKIVPFLVWYRVYSPRAGRMPVPTLSQLGWPAAEGGAWALLTAGTIALAVAASAGRPEWIEAAGVVLAAGALLFGLTLARVVHHLLPGAAHRPAARAPQARSS